MATKIFNLTVRHCGGDAVHAGPGAEIDIFGMQAEHIRGAAIRAASSAQVTAGDVVVRNVGEGIVIVEDRLLRLLDEHRYLQALDPQLIRDAAIAVAGVPAEVRENAFFLTRLYSVIKDVRGIEWAQLAAQLASLVLG